MAVLTSTDERVPLQYAEAPQDVMGRTPESPPIKCFNLGWGGGLD
jgi:hypothetical protein